MINIFDLCVILLYISIITLIIFLIIFMVKAIRTLDKVDKLVDDINIKSSKLDGVFNFIDDTTDALANVSEMIVTFIVELITGVFRKRGKNEKIEK